MTKSLVLALGCLLWASAAMAQPKTKEYDLAYANISGDILRGPRTIVAKNLNVLRDDYKFNGAISFSQPADLWSKLTSILAPAAASPPPPPPLPPPPPPPGRPVAPQTCEAGLTILGVSDSAAIQHICAARKIEDAIAGRNSNISTIATAVAANYDNFTVLVGAANTAMEKVKAGGNALKNFLLTTTGIPSQTIAGICTQLTDDITDPCGSQRPDSTFIVGIKASWPIADDVSLGHVHNGPPDPTRPAGKHLAEIFDRYGRCDCRLAARSAE